MSHDHFEDDPLGGNFEEGQIIGEVDKKDLVLPDQVLPSNLFVLPVNSTIVFPTMMAPLTVSNPRYITTIEEVIKRERVIGLLLARDEQEESEDPVKADELYDVGVVVKILKRIKMPDGSVNLLVNSLKRFRVNRVLSEKPHIVVEANYLKDQIQKSPEMDALSRMVMSQVKKLAESNPFFTDEMRLALLNAPDSGVVADLVTFALSLAKPETQELLEELNVRKRFEIMLVHLKNEQNMADLQKKIQEEVNTKINKMQREFFLKEQLRTIKKELGGEGSDSDQASQNFRERIEKLKLSDEVRKAAMEELNKFDTLSEHSPEYNVTRSYLETFCALPWNISTQDHHDLARSEEILNEDHYGLERVKDRILEFLAVRKLRLENPPKNDDGMKSKGSILCLVGPPGVGKTSVGKSVARALGRKFYRFSLGGMRDEAEIKGHRRTYIGAMPGKIIQAIKRSGSNNPVVMLDEIDKLGQSFQGDPASALLEVLDPEQNTGFIDHYLDVPFDLSKVLFVATANSMASIPAPLLDRMEVIEIPGYTLEEKEKIATQYVIPKVLKENAVPSSRVKLPKSTLRAILSDYAREPGLRSLQQQIAKIARKAAAEIVRQKEAKPRSKPKAFTISVEDLQDWLGPKRFYNELSERIVCPGVVVGLAWTSMGGDILFIEASDTPGTGQLKLTGQMGDVMTESASIAWSYVKRMLDEQGQLPPEFLKKRDLHLHIPAGAIPKDGPSAGISMASALVSLLTKQVFKQKCAMTGELSLTGKVLPVGGIKEKLLAAKRAGIKTVLLPELNQKDMAEIPEYVTQGLEIHWVSRIEEVFKIVFPKMESASSKKSASTNGTGRKKLERSVRPTTKKRKTSKRSGSHPLQ